MLLLRFPSWIFNKREEWNPHLLDLYLLIYIV